MAARLEQGLQDREWFVTGRALPELFAEGFDFVDPQVRGWERSSPRFGAVFRVLVLRSGVAVSRL